MGRYKRVSPNRLVQRPQNFYEPDLLLSSQMSSKKALGMELMIRETAWNYYRVLGFLPNPSETLRKLAKDISEYKYLLEDAFVNGCMSSRKAGTLSLKWSLDQNKVQVRQFNTIKSLFDGWPMNDIISEILNCTFFGYQPVEINWERVGGNWLPKEVVPKDPDWIRFSDLNEIRYLTKRNMVTGEPLPAYKIIMPRYRPSYERPYGRPLGSVVYWPVKFRHGGLKFWTEFCEKFGSPWVMAKYPLGTQQTRIEQMLDMIDKTIQDGVIAMPKEFDAEVIQVNKGDSSTIYKEFISNMNEDISIGILGQTLTTKVGSTGGAFAAAKVHADVRSDIINEDKSIVEMVFTTLINWIYELNWGGDKDSRPTFKLLKAPSPTKEDGDLAVDLTHAGVKFTKEYFVNRFGLTDTEFDLAPEPELGPDSQPVGGKNPDAAMLTHQGTDLAQNDSSYESSMESVQRMTRRFSENQPTKIILIRHGETQMNAKGDLIRGWKDVPLDDRGLEQARVLGQELAGTAFDGLYTSDLTRCTQTAKPIAEATGAYPAVTWTLRPWDLGKYQGQESAKVQGVLSEYARHPESVVPGGESFNSFKDRFLGEISRLKALHPGQIIGLVTHHRNDKLMAAWEAKGFPDTKEVDVDKFLQQGLEPGKSREVTL